MYVKTSFKNIEISLKGVSGNSGFFFIELPIELLIGLPIELPIVLPIGVPIVSPIVLPIEKPIVSPIGIIFCSSCS